MGGSRGSVYTLFELNEMFAREQAKDPTLTQQDVRIEPSYTDSGDSDIEIVFKNRR